MRICRRLIPLLLAACVLAAPATAPAAKRNPCVDPKRKANLRCPDLIMKRPFGLAIDPLVKPGRIVLRGGNSIDNVGRGPVELHGVRSGRVFMKARQRIYRRHRVNGRRRLGVSTGARLLFKHVTGQIHYWKYHRAASIQLWRLNRRGVRTRLVRRGPKVSYCLRDLEHSRPQRPFSPAHRVYPACDTSFSTRRVTIGTSVGWSDVYPPTYPEQWVDVTGLRGCFAYRHVADPGNGILESNERNNAATTVVRLPFHYGKQRCAGHRSRIARPGSSRGYG